jgi:predicted metal-dependent hydrolase
LKNSYWLNEPEHMKKFWPTLKHRMSHEEIKKLNKYRSMVGMPKV